MNLQMQQTGYEAALGATAKVSSRPCSTSYACKAGRAAGIQLEFLAEVSPNARA